jgi:DNA polymerase-3 subunit epsilon
MRWLAESLDWLLGGPKIGGAQEARLGAWRARRPANLDRPHERIRYVVVDVETSGLDVRRDRLLSIGAVGVVAERVKLDDAFSVVLKQREASSDANILIHGIGGQAQLGGTETVPALLDFLEYAARAPLVAFRAGFDQPVLERAAKDVFGVPVSFVWIDLAFLLPALYRGTQCESLDDWVAHFGIAPIERHQALADAYATAQLLLVALAAARRVGMHTPASLVAMQKAQRWLGTR